MSYLNKLLRLEHRLTSIINSEHLDPPVWYDNLWVAITILEQDALKQFQELFCSLDFGSWKFDSDNNIILESVLSNLEKLQREIRLEKYKKRRIFAKLKVKK